MQTQALNKPRIFDYISPLSYLEDVYKFRKKKDSYFSFERWSEELGFKSRSFIKMVLIGERKIMPSFVEKYSTRYELSEPEMNYFSVMVSHHQASDQEKSIYLQKIFEHRANVRDLQIIEDEDHFLSSPLIPHVQTLLSFNDVEKTPEAIAEMLGISADESARLMTVIEKAQLKEGAFRVGVKLGSQSLLDYHAFSLQQAIEARDLPPDQRRYRSLIFALNEKEYADLVEKINAFALQSLGEYEKDHMEDRRLYKMNLNLHPISQKRPVTK